MWDSTRDPYTLVNDSRITDTATWLEPCSSAMSSCGSHCLYYFLALGGGTTYAMTFTTNWVTVV